MSDKILLIDVDQCVRCHACEIACKQEHELNVGPRWMKVSTIRPRMVQGALHTDFIPTPCFHCDDAPCIKFCSTGALIRRDDGVVLIDKGEERIAPCNNTCPAGNDIQGFVNLIENNKPVEAWQLIKETSPLPGVCGRVCPHPCSLECNRKEFDEAISIPALERLAADSAFKIKAEKESNIPTKKERVAVIGSGPAGLSCAYFLVKEGYQVTVFEAMPYLGGMLRIGIPKYRLPREILDKEIADIEALGVSFKTNTKISDIKELKDSDAVFIATGAYQSIRLNIPGEDAPEVLPGVEFLRSINIDGKAKVGKKVVIIGGGNVAMDAARSALRLGATDVCAACLEPRDAMLAHADEIKSSESEGITIHNSKTFTRILTEGGHVTGVECLDVRSFKFDSAGKLHVDAIKGTEQVLPADTVITAIGELPDTSFLPKEVKLLEGKLSLKLDGVPVFAGGDAATRAGAVVDAIASGRRSAQAIDSHFKGTKVEEKPAQKVVPFEDINTAYYSKQTAAKMPELPTAKSVSSFSEVKQGLSLEQGIEEAKRCFSCSICNECKLCTIGCPYGAIYWDEEREEIGKCTLCVERIDDGLPPFCVQNCIGSALYFVTEKEFADITKDQYTVRIGKVGYTSTKWKIKGYTL